MKTKPTSRPPCKMQRGDIRRVPSAEQYALVSYYVCCPKCGFVGGALPDEDFKIIEDEQGVTFSTPLRCLFCHVLIHLEDDVIDLQADEETLNVQYR
ncbi:MAG: hypothetical protein GY854_18030 [Deltaproteobacteria bacterium]|nr:hypothetical protein [Deltaproteobacteria bacterium]